MTSTKKIGVLTSGGDAPGMNAAIRATVRTALYLKSEPVGIVGGYSGILANRFLPLKLESMANIIQRGGTILKTGRCLEFLQAESRTRAAEQLRAQGVETLVCIGGDGSFRGALALQEEHGISVVGIPATIDNDIGASDLSIGFDTAMNTALEAIDRIRDTAASHDRLFIVEVMGRDTGYLAMHVGLAGGAEQVFIPESPISMDKVIAHMKKGIERGKGSSILIAAEGQKPGRAYDLAQALRKKAGFEAKICILGHIQRGGSPTANDRILASRMGSFAAKIAVESKGAALMVALRNGALEALPLKSNLEIKRPIGQEITDLIEILST